MIDYDKISKLSTISVMPITIVIDIEITPSINKMIEGFFSQTQEIGEGVVMTIKMVPSNYFQDNYKAPECIANVSKGYGDTKEGESSLLVDIWVYDDFDDLESLLLSVYDWLHSDIFKD